VQTSYLLLKSGLYPVTSFQNVNDERGKRESLALEKTDRYISVRWSRSALTVVNHVDSRNLRKNVMNMQ
jgi:hypothetical protein